MKNIIFTFAMIMIIGLSFGYETLAEYESSKDSGNVCGNKYVQCTSAPCIPDPVNPDSLIPVYLLNLGNLSCHHKVKIFK